MSYIGYEQFNKKILENGKEVVVCFMEVLLIIVTTKIWLEQWMRLTIGDRIYLQERYEKFISFYINT